MKRTMPWKNKKDSSSSSSSSSDDSSSDSGSDSDSNSISKVKLAKQKGGAIDFHALNKHGYRGGLSVLKVPTPKEDEKERDWSWSTGKDNAGKEIEESVEERQRTKAALTAGEQLMNVQTRREKELEKEKEREKRRKREFENEQEREKNLSFSQKEKRKRDLGQASRGKNYVEEEKRLLRESGIYSGFDA